MSDSILTYRTRSGDVTNAAGLGVVFLSYRKKNMVYRNDVVRDILDANDCAVWFDRNLTAGEDYNAEIHAALERMNVFVLMVTPATFDPAGYVMREEIPRAMERKIPIIPILLEETDMERFAEVLGDIHTLDKRRPDEYEDGLRRALGMHLLTKNEKELIHRAQKESGERAAQTLYYQGLGWLAGENCERDPDKGAQMITAAAVSGEVPEAMRRLAQMYQTGDGVTRNWQQAVGWYDKYTAAMEPHFGEDEDSDVSLACAYEDKGVLLQSYGKLTAAKEAFTAYENICQRMVSQYGASQMRELSVSYERLGDISQAQGNLIGAQEYYLKSLEMFECLAENSDDYFAKRASSVSYNKLGDISQAQGDLSGAKEYFLKGLAIRERLAADSEEIQGQCDLSASYNRLGDISQAQGNLTDAQEHYLKGLAICERLAAESEGTEAQRNLSTSYNKLGDISQAQGNLAGAKEYYEKGLAIRERLAADSEKTEQQHDLSVSYNKLGNISQAQGDLAGAQEYFLKDLAISERLAADSEEIKAQRHLSISYEKLGDISRVQGDLAGAQEYYLKDLAISERLAADSEGTEAQRDLSVSYNRMGDISQAQGDLSGAKEYYRKGLAISERLAADSEGTEAQRDLSVSYNKLGNISQAQGDLSGAKEYYLKDLAISERLAADSEGTEAQDDIAASCYNLGILEGISPTERLDYLGKAQEIWTQLYEATEIEEYKRRADIVATVQSQIEESASQADTACKVQPKRKINSVLLLLILAVVTLVVLQVFGVINILEWISRLVDWLGGLLG